MVAYTNANNNANTNAVSIQRECCPKKVVPKVLENKLARRRAHLVYNGKSWILNWVKSRIYFWLTLLLKTLRVIEFFSLIIWDLSKFVFCHSLSFWVLSQLKLLSFALHNFIYFFSFIIICVFEFSHNLCWVSSQF